MTTALNAPEAKSDVENSSIVETVELVRATLASTSFLVVLLYT